MPTQQELLDAHREGLDAQFQKRWPNGRFTLHNRRWNLRGIQGRELGLYFVNRRPTSRARPFGPSVTQDDNDRVWKRRYQNNSLGRTKHFTSMDQVIVAARKTGCSEKLISAFQEQYELFHKDRNAWLHQEGLP